MTSALPPGTARWPNVPACYGWLSLDRRGRWRLQGEPVIHAGFNEFLGRHYGAEADGAWRVQNGPQRVFVRLEYTPWIFRCAPGDAPRSHTGLPAGTVRTVWLDDGGSLLIDTDLGIGLIDDRDLAACLGECRHDGGPVADAVWLSLMAGDPAPALHWRGLPIQPIAAATVAQRFGFLPDPQPAAA